MSIELKPGSLYTLKDSSYVKLYTFDNDTLEHFKIKCILHAGLFMYVKKHIPNTINLEHTFYDLHEFLYNGKIYYIKSYDVDSVIKLC